MLKKELAAELARRFPDEHNTLIYFTRFDHFHDQVSVLNHYLSSEEKAAAQQYATTQLTHRYIISRGLLKSILSWHMGILPEEIDLHYGKYGKPYLKESNLQFNLSHAGDFIVYVLSWVSEVGIDIEYINDQVEIAPLTDLLFSQREVSFFASLAPKEKMAYFYDVWTKKEALIKAGGWGLSYPITKIDTSLLHDNMISLAPLNPEALQERWYCYSLQTVIGYSAALASKHALDKPVGLVRASGAHPYFDSIEYALPKNLILTV